MTSQQRDEVADKHPQIGSHPHHPSHGTTGVRTLIRLIVLSIWAIYAWQMGQIPAAGLNNFGKTVALSFFIAAPLLYFLPVIEAYLRQHRSLTSVGLVNLLLGWTLIGWVAALAWACTGRNTRREPEEQQLPSAMRPRFEEPSVSATSIADELRKLAELRDQGVLTEDEFLAQKSKTLGG